MNIWNIVAAFLASLGGGAVVVIAASSWLGKVWANRIAEADRTRSEKELESHRNELQRLTEAQHDALSRKRDVYGRLVASMRVFQRKEQSVSDVERHEFLKAYDQAALWSSEEVAIALGLFVDAIVHNTDQPGSVTNDDLVRLYAECVNAMRRDCGFPSSGFVYRVIS